MMVNRAQPRTNRGCRRAGFTLLELLVAVVLAAVLMTGLWNLFGTYERLFSRGQDQAEQTQLARTLLEQIKDGTSPYQFIEVMGCPGGCIGGGGSPLPTTTEIRQKRAAAIYCEDEAQTLRASHDNPIIKQLYAEYLGQPLGERSHHLLHTYFTKRGV